LANYEEDAMTEDGLSIGFIGFGEAGFHIARGLRQAGVRRLTAYDIHSNTPGLGEKIRRRAVEAETRLADTNQELIRGCEIVFSVVTSDQAAQAAGQSAPYLGAGHFYADLNSVSPARKQSIAQTIAATGARFVEIAVMAPVPPHGHRVHMLAGGEAAGELAERLAPFGMRVEVVAREIGVAAATKMFRSIMVKGMEALIAECVLGASRYGAERRVFASLAESFPGIDWPELADYMVGRVVVHGERRAREMEEAAETLRSLGIEPIMAEATARRMDWSARVGLKAKFAGETPRGYREVLKALAEIEAVNEIVQSRDR
jgi:3-hydroxyisobutyrate dehydrogenase-like beta-hydroxyacid dehydrogenase